jgi:catechol 2,3-dioxygenase-like lactoylglutathione lyase family enzyme
MSREARLFGLTPILNVSDFGASMEYYTQKLGFRKLWDWGEPPDFGCVKRDAIEIFFCRGGQGQPGTWMSIFVDDANALHEEMRAKGAKIVMPPTDEPWGMREFHVEDPDGHTIRFGHSTPEPRDLKIKRTAVDVRMEERLAAVLAGLAQETNRSVGEVLEEVLLHSFEPLPGQVGEAVASPHAKATFHLIEGLKKKHGLDYDTHANYRFTEE